jgi:hypothetical protein
MRLSPISIERLYNQHINLDERQTPEEIVAWLGAVQAQDYYGAKWSVGLRLNGKTDKDIENALKSKKILRTWGNRGTLQFISTSDVYWFLELLAPRIIARNARRYKELGLDDKTLSKSKKIVLDALDGTKGLKRTELKEFLEYNGISTEGNRLSFILQRASLDGLIHQGIAIKNNPVYFSMEDMPDKGFNREDSLKEISKRYFYSHGPATLEDFVWWSGLTVKDAEAGLDSVKKVLKREIIDGKIYWSRSNNLMEDKTSPMVNLLPIFDDFLLAYKDRGASIDNQIKKLLKPQHGIFSPTIIVDGVVTGTWKRKIMGNKVAMELNHFKKLNKTEYEALNLEITRYSEFLEKKLVTGN